VCALKNEQKLSVGWEVRDGIETFSTSLMGQKRRIGDGRNSAKPGPSTYEHRVDVSPHFQGGVKIVRAFRRKLRSDKDPLQLTAKVGKAEQEGGWIVLVRPISIGPKVRKKMNLKQVIRKNGRARTWVARSLRKFANASARNYRRPVRLNLQ
jgi:hypothetical protein